MNNETDQGGDQQPQMKTGNEAQIAQPRRKPRSVLWAAVLSLATLGLGQVYNGQPLKGLAFHLCMLVVLLVASATQAWSTFSSMLLTNSVLFIILLAAVFDAIRTARQRRDYVLKFYNSWAYYVVIAVVINAGFYGGFKPIQRPVKSLTIASEAMSPVLHQGDLIMFDTSYYQERPIQRGDIVALRLGQEHPKIIVRRVMGLPGEKLAIEGGRVLINGQAIEDPWGRHAQSPAQPPADFGPKDIPDGRYFVLGDNRDESIDSANWDQPPWLAREDIIGRAVYIYWSGDWDRLGESLTEDHN